MKRCILIVLDSLGVGAMEDANQFGDTGADTLGHILDEMPNLSIPNLRKLGFCNGYQVADGRLKYEAPTGSFGRLAEMSKGKDTITGHWEMCGLLTNTPFKTYPEGFPQEMIKAFEEKIGIEVLGNYPASGTDIIDQLGPIHEETGKPIVYTSADSVFQIAANVDIVPLDRLYEMCQISRDMLVGKWACGRVIARPYQIIDGKRVRTSDRKDYAVNPPSPTLLDLLVRQGKQVTAIGKISDIFNGNGISKSIHTTDNMDGVDKTIEEIKSGEGHLIFTNLVDFDSKYGHRRDPIGYGKAIEDFDNRLPEIIDAMKSDDCLILCADHGNDPVHSGFDHTREYIPLVIYGDKIKGNVDLDTGNTFANIGATIGDFLEVEPLEIGESYRKQIEIEK